MNTRINLLSFRSCVALFVLMLAATFVQPSVVKADTFCPATAEGYAPSICYTVNLDKSSYVSGQPITVTGYLQEYIYSTIYGTPPSALFFSIPGTPTDVTLESVQHASDNVVCCVNPPADVALPAASIPAPTTAGNYTALFSDFDTAQIKPADYATYDIFPDDSYSIPFSVTAPPTPVAPAAPANASASCDPASHTASFSWLPSAGADSYELSVRDTTSAAWTPHLPWNNCYASGGEVWCGGLSATSQTLTGLYGSYNWEVSACTSGVCSTPVQGSVVSCTAPPSTAVAAPTNLAGSCSANGLSGTLSWDPVASATGYLAWIAAPTAIDCSTIGGSWTQNGSTMCTRILAGTLINSLNLIQGTTYQWGVYAAGTGGASPDAVGANFTCAPTAPAGLSNTCSADGTSATLSWQPPAGATTYSAFVSIINGACPIGWTKDAYWCHSPSVSDPSVSANVVPGASYSWGVSAGNSGGWSSSVNASSPFSCSGVAPNVTLTASPASIFSGQSSTLVWGSTNATSCVGSNFSTGGATSGSLSVSPTATTTYTATCTGVGGSGTASATVGVTPSVSGACGTAISTPASAAPSSNLCNSGTPTIVVSGASTWTWSCTGTGTGTTASCSVGKICATAGNACTATNSCTSVINPGTIQNDCSCNALVPSEALCTSPTVGSVSVTCDGTGTSPTLSWSPVANATYALKLTDSAGVVSNYTATSIPTTLTGLVAGMSYGVKVTPTVAGVAGQTSSTSFACAAPVCPQGTVGTYPNCVTPPPTCPQGTTGTYPNCVTTPTYPNLTAGKVSPKIAIAGDATSFSAYVENIGSAATPSGVAFTNFFQTATGLDASGDGVGVIDIPYTQTYPATLQNLGASGSAKVSVSNPFGVGTASGTYYMRLCANKTDAGTFSAVSNESSNTDNCGNWTGITLCASGQVIAGGVCTTPVVCSGGQVIDASGNCSCPGGQVLVGGTCTVCAQIPDTDCVKSNSCGNSQTFGKYRCDGSCTAPAPDESLCIPKAQLTLTASPSMVNKYQTTTLNWSATNVTSCTLSGPAGQLAKKNANAAHTIVAQSTVSPIIVASSAFTLSCVDLSGVTQSQGVSVNLIPSYIEQ